MLITKVTNETGKALILKEGTAGIKRTLAELPDQKTYKISVDANATYREYWCAEKHDDPNPVVLSSDDCQQFKEVTIKRVPSSDIYTWDGKRRDNGKVVNIVNDERATSASATSASARDTAKGIWKMILSVFKSG